MVKIVMSDSWSKNWRLGGGEGSETLGYEELSGNSQMKVARLQPPDQHPSPPHPSLTAAMRDFCWHTFRLMRFSNALAAAIWAGGIKLNLSSEFCFKHRSHKFTASSSDLGPSTQDVARHRPEAQHQTVSETLNMFMTTKHIRKWHRATESLFLIASVNVSWENKSQPWPQGYTAILVTTDKIISSTIIIIIITRFACHYKRAQGSQ